MGTVMFYLTTKCNGIQIFAYRPGPRVRSYATASGDKILPYQPKIRSRATGESEAGFSEKCILLMNLNLDLDSVNPA